VANYIALLKFTDSGIRNIREGPKRLDDARRSFEAAGGNIVQFYLTLGQYDAVAIISAPDDEAYTRTMLMLAAKGNISSTTLKALSEDQYRHIVSSMP